MVKIQVLEQKSGWWGVVLKKDKPAFVSEYITREWVDRSVAVEMGEKLKNVLGRSAKLEILTFEEQKPIIIEKARKGLAYCFEFIETLEARMAGGECLTSPQRDALRFRYRMAQIWRDDLSLFGLEA